MVFRTTSAVFYYSPQTFKLQEDEVDRSEVIQHRDVMSLAVGLVFEFHQIGITGLKKPFFFFLMLIRNKVIKTEFGAEP